MRTWLAFSYHNNFDTIDAWTLALGDIVADSEQDALDKAAAELQHLSFVTGPYPIHVDTGDFWDCSYRASEDIQAFTITPPLMNPHDFNKISRLNR